MFHSNTYLYRIIVFFNILFYTDVPIGFIFFLFYHVSNPPIISVESIVDKPIRLVFGARTLVFCQVTSATF